MRPVHASQQDTIQFGPASAGRGGSPGDVDWERKLPAQLLHVTQVTIEAMPDSPLKLLMLRAEIPKTATGCLECIGWFVRHDEAQALDTFLAHLPTTIRTLSHRDGLGLEALGVLLRRLAQEGGTLNTLSLVACSLGDKGAELIADSLRGANGLVRLDLTGNAITEAGAKSIAEALRHNTRLAALSLHYNQIGGRRARSLLDRPEGERNPGPPHRLGQRDRFSGMHDPR